MIHNLSFSLTLFAMLLSGFIDSHRVEMPYINHALGKTYYTSRGRNSGKPAFIFLHGGPGGRHQKDSPLFELARDRKVFLYDQIGGGKSSPLTLSQMKIETFVQELDHLVNAWNVHDFYLAGGSWGTTLALEYYIKTKGRGIRSLIFQSPMFSARRWADDANRLINKMPKKDQKIIQYCHEINATDANVYQDVMMRYYQKHLLRNKQKLDNMFKQANPNGRKVYAHMWGPSEFKPTGTLKNYEKTEKLKAINVPTLFLCGQHDEATPETTTHYAMKVPNAQIKIIANASHIILKEKPKAMVSAINSFIRKVEGT